MENINFLKGKYIFKHFRQIRMAHDFKQFNKFRNLLYYLNFAENLKELSRGSKHPLPFLTTNIFNVYSYIKLHQIKCHPKDE